MANTRQEMLRAIRESPDDDGLRLSLADWLDENGEPDFAEFIRLEVEAESLPEEDSRRRILKNQADLRRRKATTYPKLERGIMETRRGLPHYLQADVFDLLKHKDRFAPYCSRLFVHLHGGSGAAQTAEKEFAAGGPDKVGDALSELFASTWVRQWSVLGLDGVRLTDNRIRQMVSSSHLAGLERLAITDGADDGAVRVLSETPLPGLIALSLTEVMRRCAWDESLLTSAVVSILLAAPLLNQLESLTLWGDWLGADELLAIAASERLANLEQLSLWPRLGTGEAVRELLQSKSLANLKRLDHSRIPLDAATVALLVRAETLPALCELEIHSDDKTHRKALEARFGDGLVMGPVGDV